MVTMNVTGPRNIITTSDLATSVDPVTNETLEFKPVKESLEVGQRPSYKATTSKGRTYVATYDDSLHIDTYLEEDADETEGQSTSDFNPRAFKAGEEDKGKGAPTRNVTQEEIDAKIDRNNIDGGPVPSGEFAGRRQERERQEKEAKKGSRKSAKEEDKDEDRKPGRPSVFEKNERK